MEYKEKSRHLLFIFFLCPCAMQGHFIFPRHPLVFEAVEFLRVCAIYIREQFIWGACRGVVPGQQVNGWSAGPVRDCAKAVSKGRCCSSAARGGSYIG